MLSAHGARKPVLVPLGDAGDGRHLESMHIHRELAELVCESAACNPQLHAYDAMVTSAIRVRNGVMDSGRMALVEFGVPAWKTVRAVYTLHFKHAGKWECSRCGGRRKWGDE